MPAGSTLEFEPLAASKSSPSKKKDEIPSFSYGEVFKSQEGEPFILGDQKMCVINADRDLNYAEVSYTSISIIKVKQETDDAKGEEKLIEKEIKTEEKFYSSSGMISLFGSKYSICVNRVKVVTFTPVR